MSDSNYTEKEYYSNVDGESKRPGIGEKVGSVLTGIIKGFFDSIQTLVIALALFVVVYLWILSPHQVSGRSMLPNFENGEILLADKFVPRFSGYKRGDVIIFKYDNNKDFIKRVIGLPGEKIRLNEGKVYINGKELNESYLPEGRKTYAKNTNFLSENEEKVVPTDSYFALGDNREESSDSREIGFISPDTHEIKGRVWIVYWPLDRARIEPSITYNI